MNNRELVSAFVDEQGQITLSPHLCRELGWEPGRRLLAFQGSYAEAILALPASPYLLLIEPMTLYRSIREAQEAVRQADFQQERSGGED